MNAASYSYALLTLGNPQCKHVPHSEPELKLAPPPKESHLNPNRAEAAQPQLRLEPEVEPEHLPKGPGYLMIYNDIYICHMLDYNDYMLDYVMMTYMYV